MLFVPHFWCGKAYGQIVEVSNFYLYYTYTITQHTHTHSGRQSCSCSKEIWEIVAYFSAAAAAAVGLTELLFVCFIAWHRHFAVEWVKASAPSLPIPSRSLPLTSLCILPFKLRNWELWEKKLHRKPKLFIVARTCSPCLPLSLSFSLPLSLSCCYSTCTIEHWAEFMQNAESSHFLVTWHFNKQSHFAYVRNSFPLNDTISKYGMSVCLSLCLLPNLSLSLSCFLCPSVHPQM